MGFRLGVRTCYSFSARRCVGVFLGVHMRFFCALFVAGVAHAQQTPLTLDAALQSATDRSASMQAAQASVRASSEAAVKAGQLPDPMLKAVIDNLPINGPQRFTVGQDFMTMRRISGFWVISVSFTGQRPSWTAPLDIRVGPTSGTLRA